MKLISALAGGLAGACAMTILHELVRKIDKDAPRMDLMGMEALSKGMDSAGVTVPGEKTLYKEAMAGDIAGNTLFYSLAGIGDDERTGLKGTLLGVAAGLGGIYLPGVFGLNKDNSSRTDKTKVLTGLYYALGGVIASEVMTLIDAKIAHTKLP